MACFVQQEDRILFTDAISSLVSTEVVNSKISLEGIGFQTAKNATQNVV